MQQSNNKPSFLYRGIIIPYDKFSFFNLTDVDLTVPYDPIIDENGNKVVLDGNEYGVYMTDNKTMVNDVYGNIHGHGITLQKEIRIGFAQRQISIPSIGISYEINTQGLDVRKPWIKSTMKGHYNNGFQGDEWIADKIPAKNYRVFRIKIGSDILHEAENIPIIDSNIKQAQNDTVKNIQMRKYRLDSLINELAKMTPNQRYNIGLSELNILKTFFGPNGIRYINPDNIDLSNNIGRIKYLMATFYRENNSTIDFNTLSYIDGLKQKLSKTDTPELFETLQQIISDDLKINNDKKNAFIQRRTKENGTFTTTVFDKKDALINNVLNNLVLLKNKYKNKKQDENKESDTRQEIERLQLTKEELLEEQIKSKFHVDIDPALKVALLEDLFTDSKKINGNIENVEQIERKMM